MLAPSTPAKIQRARVNRGLFIVVSLMTDLFMQHVYPMNSLSPHSANPP
jgi:hypothetical protein